MRWPLPLAALALTLLAAASLAQLPPGQEFGARGRPTRVVSLNLCLDQMVLALAKPENVASVTWLATDPRSAVLADRAARVPRINHGAAEEILPLNPDLVLAGAYITPFTVRMLRRTGYNVEVLDAPTTLESLRAQVRLVGDLLRERGNADAALAEMDATLAAAAPKPGVAAKRAAVFQPGGFTAGPGSFEHEILTAAGLANVAGETGIRAYGHLSLEELLVLRPDLVVSPEYVAGRPSIAEQMLRHPAVRRAGLAQHVATVPANLWSCPGLMNAEAVRILAAARDAL